MATVGTDFARRTVGKRWGEAKADHETTRNWLTLFGFPVGETGSLTAGVDTITGTTGNDTINALSVKADGSPANTLSAFDSVDGGVGNDTLNIYSNGTENIGLNGASVKNVETININNTNAGFGVVDASKFVGATAINQVNVAGNVTGLAAGTTAGFNGIDLAALSVAAADAATSASVVLTDVKGAALTNVAVLEVSGAALNAVNVSGTIAQHSTAVDDPAAVLDLTVTAGKGVQSVSVNTAVNTTLAVADGADATKPVTSVDASASTGAIDYQTAAATVATIKTGAGADKATITFAGTATANAASLSTGNGNDTLTVNVTKGAATAVTAAVDAGAGNDTVNLTINAGVTNNVQAGAGNDSVVVTGTIKTTDKIDGGVGTDSISLTAKSSYVADDYIVLNKVLTGFETLQLTGATAVVGLDAAQLASNYTTIDLNAGSSVDNVGTQALVANGALTAEAKGYVRVGEGSPAATAIGYAGTLNVTEKLSGTVQAHAETVNLTVEGGKGDAAALVSPLLANDAILAGEAKSATVTLSAGTDTKGTDATTDDAFVASSVSITNSTAVNGLKDLASLTLSGNGNAVVTNVDGTKLATVDASGLTNTGIDGKVVVTGSADTALDYTSSNTAAETIKLGAGVDSVALNASTYGKADTVSGLHLVLDSTGKALDTLSDTIQVGDATGAFHGFQTFTTTQTDLDLALKDAAAYEKVAGTPSDNLVFQLGGNTYIYHDAAATTGGTDTGTIDANDTVVQLTGQVDLAALQVALA